MKFNLDDPKYNTVDPFALDLMKKMLTANPQSRIKAS